MRTWTISNFISHFQLNKEEVKECRDFLEDFLSKNGLLGGNFRHNKSRPIKGALSETLRTADHNDVPSPILNISASPSGMRELVEFSLRINASYVEKRQRPSRARARARHEDLPSDQVIKNHY
ncbi:hypothetical protein V8E54_008228 [Elaphomyces granulatus]